MSHTREKCPEHWTPIQKAGYFLVHEYRHNGHKGPGAMAPRIGKKSRTLNNEADPDCIEHKFGVNTMILAEIEAGSAEMLHAHAQMLNHVCFRVPSPDLIISNVELLTAFTKWQRAMGMTCGNIHDAFDPNGPNGSRISKAEAKKIKQAGQEHMAKFAEFIVRIDELAE